MMKKKVFIPIAKTMLLAVLAGCGSSASRARSTPLTFPRYTVPEVTFAENTVPEVAVPDETIPTTATARSTPDWTAIEAERALCQNKALAQYPISGALDYSEISSRLRQQSLYLSQCLNIVAMKYGVNYGETRDEVSTLYEACAGGDMEGCDSLYSSAPEGSEERRFAGTCGDTMVLGPRDTCVGRSILGG